jgi:hypothetical protein
MLREHLVSRISLLTILVFFSARAQSPLFSRSYLSLEKYIELENSAVDKHQGSPLVTIYLGGTIESLMMANAILLNEAQRPLFCEPESGLDVVTLRALLNKYIQKNRLFLSKSDFNSTIKTFNTGATSLIVLQEAYPPK